MAATTATSTVDRRGPAIPAQLTKPLERWPKGEYPALIAIRPDEWLTRDVEACGFRIRAWASYPRMAFSVAFEELHGALVLLCGGEGLEGAEVAALAGL